MTPASASERRRYVGDAPGYRYIDGDDPEEPENVSPRTTVAGGSWEVPPDISIVGEDLQWSWDTPALTPRQEAAREHLWDVIDSKAALKEKRAAWLRLQELEAAERPVRRVSWAGGADLMLEFAALHDAENEEILTFAKAYGPLLGMDDDDCMLERPGSPLGLLGDSGLLRDDDAHDLDGQYSATRCGYWGDCGPRGDPPFREPLVLWRTLASQVDAILHSAKLQLEEWDRFFGLTAQRKPQNHLEAFKMLTGVLNTWLGAARITLQLEPVPVNGSKENVTFVVGLQPHDVFGAILGGLAMSLGDVHGFAVCVDCGKWFAPKVRREGPRHCPECRNSKTTNKASKAGASRKTRADVRDAIVRAGGICHLCGKTGADTAYFPDPQSDRVAAHRLTCKKERDKQQEVATGKKPYHRRRGER